MQDHKIKEKISYFYLWEMSLNIVSFPTGLLSLYV